MSESYFKTQLYKYLGYDSGYNSELNTMNFRGNIYCDNHKRLLH
jgi:hypothetical protein